MQGAFATHHGNNAVLLGNIAANEGSNAALFGNIAAKQGIIAMKHMSVNARNVKIITAEGRVTLRGPVNTAEEKVHIGEIAASIAQLENVDNQIEVK